MPVHRCSFDALETCVADIERSTETIVGVVPHGDAVAIVTRERQERANPKGVERR